MKDTKVHFICRGNTYRSRLAAAYLNSLGHKSITVVTSGVIAKKQPMVIRWYAQRILERYEISHFASKKPRQLTGANLNDCDLIVFFGQRAYDACIEKHEIKKPHVIWEIIKDIQPKDSVAKIVKSSEKTFKKIKRAVRKLVSELAKKSPIAYQKSFSKLRR